MSERPRLTGRTIVAVDPSRPPSEILRYVRDIRSSAPEFAADGGADVLARRTMVWRDLGVAVIEMDPQPLREFVADVRRRGDVARSRFDGAVVGRERFLYSPRALTVPPNGQGVATRTVLDILGVNGHQGAGVHVLVLDAGFNGCHPDFVDRNVNRMTFVEGEPQLGDISGHGTHCAGLAGGPQQPSAGSRYGVACDARLSTGRVMSRATGSAVEASVFEGLEWAIRNRVAVVNMSFGVDVMVDEEVHQPFEAVAKRALDSGVLLVAAAGNDPEDAEHPVEHPANCPSVMAVGALDSNQQPAAFSCIGRNEGQKVDIAAPGFRIRSSFQNGYEELSGTSMAAALVTGVAALWAESDPGLRGQRLWDAVVASSLATPGFNLRQVGADVAAGLAQAPRR